MAIAQVENSKYKPSAVAEWKKKDRFQ
jgi:hypothetical protein